MARINRSLSHPHGGFIGRPHTRDRRKRQSEHAWWTALDRPTIEDLMKDLMKENDEENPTWKNKMNGVGGSGW